MYNTNTIMSTEAVQKAALLGINESQVKSSVFNKKNGSTRDGMQIKAISRIESGYNKTHLTEAISLFCNSANIQHRKVSNLRIRKFCH